MSIDALTNKAISVNLYFLRAWKIGMTGILLFIHYIFFK